MTLDIYVSWCLHIWYERPLIFPNFEEASLHKGPLVLHNENAFLTKRCFESLINCEIISIVGGCFNSMHLTPNFLVQVLLILVLVPLSILICSKICIFSKLKIRNAVKIMGDVYASCIMA